MKILKEDMIGQSNINKFGEKFTIYDYKDYEHIYIIFNESNYKTKTTHDAFKNGRCCDECNYKYVIPSRLMSL